MLFFNPNKKKSKKRRDALCNEADIFIQVHFVRERNNERYKFNTLKLKSDPERDAVIQWYEENGNPDTYSEIILMYLKDNVRDSKNISEKYSLGENYFNKLKENDNYVPSKGEALTLCFALKLNFEETKAVLKAANYALTNSEKSDLIIRFFIQNNNYNLSDLNYVLNKFCEIKLKDL